MSEHVASSTPLKKAGYERSDVSARRVVTLLGIVGACLVLSIPLAVAIVKLVAPARSHQGPEVSQAYGFAPRLQVDAKADRLRLEAEARDRLEGYGPSTEGVGHARIPIERAMQILAETGWPDTETKGDKP